MSVLFSIVGVSPVILYRHEFTIDWYLTLIGFIFFSAIIFWYWLHRKIKSHCDSDEAFWKKQIKKGMERDEVIKLKNQPNRSEITNDIECLYYNYSLPNKNYIQMIKIKDKVVIDVEVKSEKCEISKLAEKILTFLRIH